VIGEQIGPYRVLEELKAGGMGRLVLALDTRLQRKVVLKFLPDHLHEDESYRRRFERESNALAAINHPNIVTIHSVEDLNGRLFLVMEWIEGAPLNELLLREGLPLATVLEYMLPVTVAVAAAHRAGIVHRDLKPANVMVRRDGNVKVVDFGLAKMEQQTVAGPLPKETAVTRQGIVVGTIPYMAPEQLEAQPADARSDIFSLGVMLFELSTGRLPFLGASDASIASAILRDDPPRLAALKADLPVELDAIVQRCLAKEPARRFQDASALAGALQALQRQSQAGGLAAAPTAAALTPAPAPSTRRWQGVAIASAVLLAGALGLWQLQRRASPGTLPPRAADNATIAVLPLRNLSNDAEQEYFTDGATEAMIANLAKVSTLRVTSRNSIMRYKGAQTASLKDIAGALSVQHLVEGSVMRAGDQVVVTVELVDPQNDRTLWGETYHGSMGSLMGFEGRVAEEVAGKILGDLPPEIRARLAQHPNVPDEVYELYLRGRFLHNKRTPDNLIKALDLYRQALDRSPGFALALAATAEVYAQLGSFGYAVMSPRESIPKAVEAARKAISFDETLSEAHGALALALFFDWRWAAAPPEFERALKLNPSNAEAWHQYAEFLTAKGRFAEALTASRRARELDPLSLILNESVAIADFFAGDFAECEKDTAPALALDGNFWLAHHLLGECYSAEKRFDDAEREFGLALTGSRRSVFTLSAYGRHLARAGKKPDAQKVLAEIDERAAKEYVAPVLRAKVHFALGNIDEGFKWMSKALDERDHGLAFLAVDRDFDAVRKDPRFVALLRSVGLTEALSSWKRDTLPRADAARPRPQTQVAEAAEPTAEASAPRAAGRLLGRER
jgi:TolB-like protein/Tfp pilus assembly protein PilF